MIDYVAQVIAKPPILPKAARLLPQRSWTDVHIDADPSEGAINLRAQLPKSEPPIHFLPYQVFCAQNSATRQRPHSSATARTPSRRVLAFLSPVSFSSSSLYKKSNTTAIQARNNTGSKGSDLITCNGLGDILFCLLIATTKYQFIYVNQIGVFHVQLSHVTFRTRLVSGS